MPTATATLPKKLKAGVEYRIPHTLIIIKENIRGDASKIDPKMYASIKENGVTSPLMVTPDYIHIDGERRYHCCNELAKELNVPYIEVPVIVRDVPENQIPIVQFTLQERKNLNTSDINRAVYLHAERNPEVQLKELADLFHISKTSAFNCVRIQKVPTLKKLVQDAKLTQNAALTVIDHFLTQSGATEDAEYDEDETTKALQDAEDLGKALEANIAANVKLDKDNKPIAQNPWHLRNVNTYLVSVGKTPIETKKTEKSDIKKFNLPALVQGMLDSFTITPTGDDKVTFNGTLTLEQFEALKELSQEKKKGELIEIDNTNVEQDAFDTWKEYSDFYKQEKIVIVQDSITRYRTYEGSVQILEEIVKIKPTVTNGVQMTIIAKKDMRTVITQLLNKGWSVVRINKENAKSRLKNSPADKPTTTTATATEESETEIQKELKEITQAPATPVVKASKLQEKLNTSPVVLSEEDEEFDLIQNGGGGDFEEFIGDITETDE